MQQTTSKKAAAKVSRRTCQRTVRQRAQAKRPGRLPACYYDQRDTINAVFADHNSKYEERNLLATQIGVLLKNAGLARERRDVLEQPGALYIAAIKALRDKGEPHGLELCKIDNCLNSYRARRVVQADTTKQITPPQPPPADQPATPDHPPRAQQDEYTINASVSDSTLKSVGIKKDDRLYAQAATRELQPGELGALYRIGAGAWRVGPVKSVTPDTITLEHRGQSFTYNRADLQLICRVTWFARRVKPVALGPEHKLKQLRKRLDRLNESDDVTDSTARFRVEKEIYNLERERDEWPEVIAERGAR
jgi:hypothetical protein